MMEVLPVGCLFIIILLIKCVFRDCKLKKRAHSQEPQDLASRPGESMAEAGFEHQP